MGTLIRKVLSATMFAVIAGNASVAAGGYREQLKVTQVELAQLPRFCWLQFEVPNATSPEFYIPRSCGPGTNHYCPGLLSLIRAKSAVGKAKRMSLLGGAQTDIRYTLEWMKDYPSCPIRGHVEASRVEVDNLLRMYGGAGSKTPGTAK